MKSAYNRALEALARRASSTKGLGRWLRVRDYPTDEIGLALDRLTASGLLDDEKYAIAFARSRLVDRGLSKRRVAMELARNGIANHLIDRVISAVLADEGVDEDSVIAAVATKKWRALAKLDPAVARRRLMGFLARRGYGGDAVRRVVSTLGHPSSSHDSP